MHVYTYMQYMYIYMQCMYIYMQYTYICSANETNAWLGESGDEISAENRPQPKQGEEDYL